LLASYGNQAAILKDSDFIINVNTYGPEL